LDLYFNSNDLREPTCEYVAWADIMGMGPAMGRSLHISANFVFKLHIAALQSSTESVRIYPVMDGFYAVSPEQKPILEFLTAVFDRCAEEFLTTSAQRPLHRFIVRAALAHGFVIRGEEVPDKASNNEKGGDNILATNPGYRNSLLLGLPVVQAHEYEREAPPFGIYVHESARSHAPATSVPLHFVWWHWGNKSNPNWSKLLAALKKHYAWCRKVARSIEYKEDRINDHQKMAEEYFV
jgi:hypothetical protein